MRIENQLSLFIFHFLIKKKMKIEHRFSFFIFQLSEKMNDPNIHALLRFPRLPVRGENSLTNVARPSLPEVAQTIAPQIIVVFFLPP